METTNMETTVAETKDTEMVDTEMADTDLSQQTSPMDQSPQDTHQSDTHQGDTHQGDTHQGNHSTSSTANGTLDSTANGTLDSTANNTLDSTTDDKSDSTTDGKSDSGSDDNSGDQPPASQQPTNLQEQKLQEQKQDQQKSEEHSSDQAKNGEAKNDQAKNGEAKKVAGLSLNPSTATNQTTNQTGNQATNQAAKKASLQTRLAQEQASTQSKLRKKKLIRYTVGAVVVVGIGMYFYGQLKNLATAKATSLQAPGKIVRIDSTAQQIDPPTKSYEQEAKNHYQDSLHRAIQKDALGHISMDWRRLYDVDRYEQNNPQTTGKDTATPVDYSDKSLYDLIRIETALADSVTANERTHERTLSAIKSDKAQNGMTQNRAKKATSGKASGKASGQASGKAANTNALLGQKTTEGNSLFNVVHGSTNGSTNSNGTANGNYVGNGNRSENDGSSESEGAEPVIVRAVITRAVVHGNHKVKAGSKVAFRLLEPVTFQGARFEKNTILIGIATFRNGRVNFSDFRSKSLSSVSASHGSVASTALPLVCYDTDMVAGISVSDQSPVETQTRQAGSSALSDAANDVSYSIPYGSLARAASSLTRGVASGKRQQREMFIDLSDNYPVLLELMPPKTK